MDERRLYSLAAVATFTGYCKMTIYRAVWAGDLRGRRPSPKAPYRFLGADVVAWMNRAG